MKIKILILALLVVSIFGAPTSADTSINDSGKLIYEFTKALHDKDVSKLNSLIEPSVKIPEIRENTPINSLQTLPSPRKNTFAMIGNFREDCLDGREGGCLERIAFIWEVSIKDNKISKIKVISDVANPHMNELILTKKYKEKFNKELLVPVHFPFKMTHVSGKISGEKIALHYKNIELPAVLEIQAEPNNGNLILPKKRGFKPVSLKKNCENYIGKTLEGYELIFISDMMQYNVKLDSASSKYKPSKSELIKVANSMLFMKEPWAKYPDNSDINFKDADDFYRSLDKNEYIEFENAKLNIREKTSFENVNKVLARADQYGARRVGGDGFHPNRQVYVFVTVSQDGQKNTMVVYDAETGEKNSESRNWEKS